MERRLGIPLHLSWPARAVSILAGKHVCPSRGEYQLQSDSQPAAGSDNNLLWSSSKQPRWIDYKLSLLDRLRGAELELTLEGDAR